MSDNSTQSVPFYDVHDSKHLIQRRIRHITSIQVRNLTPFPARDALASALFKPVEQHQFPTHGHLPDDLDVALTRRRRRVSVNSISTLPSLRSDDGEGSRSSPDTAKESRGRRRTSSRVSFPEEKGDRPISSSVGRSAPTIRTQRVRTTSAISTSFAPPGTSDITGDSAPSFPISTILQDHSQCGLEKVIKSRLVETFLAINVPPSMEEYANVPEPTQSPRKRVHSPPISTPPPQSPLSPKFPSGSMSPRKDKDLAVADRNGSSRRESWSSFRTTASAVSPNGHSRTLSLAPSNVHSKGKSANSPSASQRSFPQSSSSSTLLEPAELPVPNYLSSIHRPSTNPSFAIDSKSDYAPWTDTSGGTLKLELWAKVGSVWKEAYSNSKGKEKACPHQPDRKEDNEWQVLQEWDIDLNNLVPLAEDDEKSSSSSHLPSNSLLLTLNPPGQVFFAPSSAISRTRSPSPSAGYASDPESNVRSIKHAGDISDSSMTLSDAHTLPLRRRYRRGAGRDLDSPTNVARTAGWQDLFKLATLQTCISDNESSLAGIIHGIDRTLSIDQAAMTRREIYEREGRISELRANYARVCSQSQQLRDDILRRREELRERQRLLALVREQEEAELRRGEEIEEDLIDEQARLQSLRSLFKPTRTTLVSTLSSIFPIELLSPPDLLFTIVDVPLPIPLSSNDPAPPLSLPNHKEVNEEAVATSLGYAALVVHLLAAYLGKRLVYPITYVGSRSLIRDGISAMVGPRMFPLFSKGVDTYRFEYGVFLLNKDVEMLMVEYELRAIDIRHTLPNLKNLLLTLTSGEGVPVGPPRHVNSPLASLSGLESPRAESPSQENSTGAGATTPKANSTVELPNETTPPASGSTTPTGVSMDTLKKSSRFLGLSPFAGFLRVRYPSSLLTRSNETGESAENSEVQATTSPDPGQGENTQDNGGFCEDESDRRTIGSSALNSDVDPANQEEGKMSLSNGHLADCTAPKVVPEEKYATDPAASFAAPTALPITQSSE